MNWCDSVGKKIHLKGLHSLSSRNNLNGWCYSIARIWIWLTHSIVTHPLMTLTVTKRRKWKVLLCNLHVDLHVRVLNMVTSRHSVRSQALLFPNYGLRYLFQTKQNRVFTEYVWQLITAKTLNNTNFHHFIKEYWVTFRKAPQRTICQSTKLHCAAWKLALLL